MARKCKVQESIRRYIHKLERSERLRLKRKQKEYNEYNNLQYADGVIKNQRPGGGNFFRTFGL
jgi:hypothetical protein